MAARAGRAIALALVLAAAPAFTSPLRAQEPDTGFVELILQLTIERGPERTITALGRDSVALLPLRLFLDLAEIRVTEVVPGHRVAGRLEPAGIPFWIDTDLGQRRRGEQRGALMPTDAHWVGDELYVATPVAGELLGVLFRMYWADLALYVADAADLPVRRRLTREAQRAVVLAASRGDARREVPLARAPEPLLDVGVLDYALTVPSRAPGDNFSLASSLGLAVVGGDFAYRGTLVRAEGVTTHDGRSSWTRAWPERRALRQLRAGDTFLEGQRARSVRGAVISNVPFQRSADFAFDRIAGLVGAGWEIEVLSGGRLLAFSQADSSGRYAVRVPLQYGPNPFEVRAYGPSGQVVSESYSFDVPFARLPPRQFEYLLGGGTCEADPCTHLMVADARYGVSRRVTVRGGVEGFRRDSLADTWHPYAALATGVSRAVSVQFATTYEAVTELRGRYYPSPDLILDVAHSWFDSSAAMPLFGAPLDRKRTDVNLFWRPSGGRIHLSVMAQQGRGARPRTTVSAGPTLRIAGITLAAAARRSAQRSPSGLVLTSGLDASVHLNLAPAVPVIGRSLVTARTRSDCAGELLSCGGQVSEARVGLGRQLSADFRLDAAVTWNRLPERAVFELSATTTLPYLRAITRAGYSTQTEYVSSQGIEGSVLWDRRGRRLRFEDGRSVGFAGITGVMFQDANDNGWQDADEPGVPEALVRVGSRSVVTDSAGRYSSFDLIPFERTVVQVDTAGLIDPTWVPAQAAVAVRPAPNGFRYLPLPLVPGQELSGTVTLDGRPVGGVAVQAVDTESGAVKVLTTFEDGAFYTPSMPPGTYRLTVAAELLSRLGAYFAPVTVELRRSDRPPPSVRLELVTGNR